VGPVLVAMVCSKVGLVGRRVEATIRCCAVVEQLWSAWGINGQGNKQEGGCLRGRPQYKGSQGGGRGRAAAILAG
jgi:hypothetical protein